jgi:hypothetical protein
MLRLSGARSDFPRGWSVEAAQMARGASLPSRAASTAVERSDPDWQQRFENQ